MSKRQFIEEATDDEIAELYRKRGEEPPPPRKSNLSENSMERNDGDAPSKGSGRRRMRERRKPGRVLWRPIRPQLVNMVTKLPQSLQANPIMTGSTVALLLPFTGLILFCLPGTLLADHCLQKVYDRYSDEVEVAVENGKQMGKLGFVIVRLSARQGYRVVRRQLKKIEADPANVIKEVGNTLYDAVTHPKDTAGTLYSIGVESVSSVISWASWAKNQVQAMRDASPP